MATLAMGRRAMAGRCLEGGGGSISSLLIESRLSMGRPAEARLCQAGLHKATRAKAGQGVAWGGMARLFWAGQVPTRPGSPLPVEAWHCIARHAGAVRGRQGPGQVGQHWAPLAMTPQGMPR